MRIGIIGDIHANLPALEAVLAVMKPKCDRIYCAGDIVGYGPQPAECIEVLRKNKILSVCGNHDEYTVIGTSGTLINPVAKEVIDWTRQVLPLEHKRWLADLPDKLKIASGIELLHSSHVPTKRWFYVVDERSAEENFRYQKSALTFFGHTHLPMIASFSDGLPVRVGRLEKCTLIGWEKYLVNAGSVGQSRDGDPRASAVIYDSKTQDLEPIKVNYDRSSVTKLMKKLGFSPFLINRLDVGR